jgi:predicted anti-sigma-YlaC factor YlaD
VDTDFQVTGNWTMAADDNGDMRCETSRDAISALVDHEDPAVDPRALDAHLSRCVACREFRAAAERTRRLGAVRTAAAMPDLSPRVTRLAAVADRAAARTIVRVALAVIAVEILVLSVPTLVARDEQGSAAHDSRHLGAFIVAYAVALLVVVVRPARARTVLPVACVVAAALVITAVVDLVSGNIPLAGELRHLPELAAAGLVWALTVPTHRFVRPRAQHGRPDLQVVEPPERNEEQAG